MTRDDARKLMSGYATGSLTEAERMALMEAALADQMLFDELAEEAALKEVLDEPGARQRLIAALEPPRNHRAWLWAMAAATVAVVVGVVVSQRTPPPPQQIAQALKSPEPVAPPEPVPPRPTPAPVKRKVTPPVAEPQATPEARDAAPAPLAMRAQNETVTVTTAVANYFSYIVRRDGSLQITILEPGFLSVTATLTRSEVAVFPSAAVAPPRTIRLQVPSDAIGLVVGFSKTPGINDAPIQQVAATGFGIDLKPSYGKIRIQPTPLFLKLEPR